VAIGPASDRLGTVERDFAARVLAWIVEHFDDAPTVLNLLSPTLPEKRDLVADLEQRNPGLFVLWLPRPVLALLSRTAVLAQRMLRRDRVPVDVEKVFAVERYNTAEIRGVAEQMDARGFDATQVATA
jgi:hypothetical protein